MQRNKTIGVIGGFGPDSTARFFLRLVDRFRATHGGRQPHVVIENVAVPRNLEQDLLLRGQGIHKFTPLLTSAAKELQRNGADFIVFPCNTLHVHENEIRASVAIPFVSIVEATVKFLKEKRAGEVALIGSGITVRQNLFKKKAVNIRFITVPERIQKCIDKGLDHIVGTQDEGPLAKALKEAILDLKQTKVKDVLVACTDFHGLLPTTPDIRIHDTLDILVDAAVAMV